MSKHSSSLKENGPRLHLLDSPFFMGHAGLCRLTLTIYLVFQCLVCPTYAARKGEKPRIVRAPSSIATIAGQSALFVCLVEGNPAPKVQWKVSGTAVSEEHFGKTARAPRGSVLRVTNTLPNYNGAVITCTATNALGRAEESATLTVYADESVAPAGYPQFLNSFSVIVAKKNAGAELECRATGDPQPEISWFKNSVPVDMGNPRFTQLSEGNLKISNLIEDDEGKYECAATNDKGTRLSSGDNLLVRENVETSLQLIAPSTKRFRPHFTNRPPARQIVSPGGRLSLSCTAVGAPVPTVDWYRGTRKMQREQLDKQPPGTAKILLLDLSESVNVTCVAESTMGRIYHDVQVLVKTLPPPPGKPDLLEVGPTSARLAFKPSIGTPSSPIVNYLFFWLLTKDFDNRTLHSMPVDMASLAQSSSVHADPTATGQEQLVRPNMLVLPSETKNFTLDKGDRVRLAELSEALGPMEPSIQYQAILASVGQLKPYMNYTAWARAVGPDDDASIPGPIMTFMTQELVPSSPPLNVHAQAFSNAAVTVYWDPPLEANGWIRAYRVYYTDRPQLELAFWDTNIVDVGAGQQRSTTSDTQVRPNTSGSGQLYILSHLTANATYMIRVSAVNSKGEGPASDVVVVMVRPGLLSPPRNLTAVAKSSHEIYLTWLPPEGLDQSGNSLLHYQLEYAPTPSLVKPTDQSQQWTVTPITGSAEPVQTRVVDAKLRALVVDQLRPDFHYIFSLSSVSNAGPGVRTVSYGRTKKFVPAEPTNLTVEAVSASELKVWWQPPKDSHPVQHADAKATRIAYYDLSWRSSTSTGGWIQSEYSSAMWASQSLGGSPPSVLPDTHGFSRRLIPATPASSTNWYSATISGLQPATYYVVHLRAVAPSGSGDRAVASPVRTWEPPPAAPRKLHLFSQILPPTGFDLPPQVIIKASWETPGEQTEGILAGHGAIYRIRWRLLIGFTDSSSVLSEQAHLRQARSTYRSDETTDRWLFWTNKHDNGSTLVRDTKEVMSTNQLIPEKYHTGEINTTATSWNSPAGLFLLGNTYEFRVAVITRIQAGQEAIQLIALEGSAPTGGPTDVAIEDTQGRMMLSWNPPDWNSRHGPFSAYEVKCEAAQPAGSHHRAANVTLDNSQVEWPNHLRISSHSLIAWPSGRMNLGPALQLTSNTQDILACMIRGRNKYGVSPWSAKVNLPTKNSETAPPPPKDISAIHLPSGDVRIGWSMPHQMVQTLIPSSLVPNQSVPSEVIYKRFAVYMSPRSQKNWIRHVTNGPVTEFFIPKLASPDPDGYQVRVSSIGSGGHEGTWSDVVYTHYTSPGSAIGVVNLTCHFIYISQQRHWSMQLTWTQPVRLMTGMHVGRLSHYTVTYGQMRSQNRRELSVQPSNNRNEPIVEHIIDWLQSDTAYTASVRPMIKPTQLLTQDALVDLYGIPEEVHCATPKAAEFSVRPPWVTQTAVTRPSSPNVRIGCAAVEHVPELKNPINPVEYEIMAVTLGPNMERTILAQWSSVQVSNAKYKHVFHVDLSKPRLHRRSLTHETRLIGSRLEPKRSYAITLKACMKPNEELFSSDIVQYKTNKTCYQSLWIQPVSLSLPPPVEPSNAETQNSDPDKLLWPPQSDGDSALNQPPSDDATAHGPGWLSNVHGKRQSDTIDKSSSDQSEPTIVGLEPSQVVPVRPEGQPSSVKHSNPSVLIAIVTVAVLLVVLVLLCMFLIAYRKRQTESGRIEGKTWQETNQWPGRSPYSLLHWVSSNKRRSGHQRRPLSSSVHLTELHGPSFGSGGSFVGNIHSTMTSYTAGLTSPFYEDSLPGFGPANQRTNGNVRTYGGSMDPITPQFGSLRTEAMRHDFASIGPLDSPNGTLHLGDGLHRVESASLGRPPLSVSSPVNTCDGPFSRPIPADHPPGCNGFSVGSRRSINTTGSKGLTTGSYADFGLNITSTNVAPVMSRLNYIGQSRMIRVGQLAEHVQALKADNGRLMAAEFESIDPGGQFTWEHSNRPANRVKNRYANVIAYDHSRVVLQQLSPSDVDTDYINANYLDGYCKQNAYIATQGPLPQTVGDFWRMIWEQRSAMIVSMTRLEERARVKCEQYWPGSGSTLASPAQAISSPTRFGKTKHLDPTFGNTDLAAIKPASLPPYRANQFFTAGRTSGDSSLIFANDLSQALAMDDFGRTMGGTNQWLPNSQELMGEAQYGDITVGLLDTIELAYYTIRTFILHKTGTTETREVRQLQFTAWPDHGVPNHPAPLLMFLRRVRAECPPDSGPIVVHCSAGVGRTGAFILLDILLEQMRHEKAVDVFSTVSRLRAQRNFMVQTEDQYAFVYEALVEAAASGNTELPVRQLEAHWSRLTKPNSGVSPVTSEGSREDSTGLELEFSQLVAQSQLTTGSSAVPTSVGLLSPIDPISMHDEDRATGCSSIPRMPALGSSNSKTSAAKLKVNLTKNRHPDFVPHDANRVALRAVRGVDGSDYINASYIDGYRSRAVYIATQAPLTSTLEDFWRMIWETGSCLIVRLESLPCYNDPRSMDLPTYWPTVQSLRHGYLVVDPIATYTMTAYVMRELRLTDTRDGTSRTIRQFDATPTTDAMIDFELDPQSTHRLHDTLSDGVDSLGAASSPPGSSVDTALPLPVTASTPEGVGGGRARNRLLLANFRQRYGSLCEAVLETVIQVHKTKEHFGMDGPITVHCNLGAGRTGVFLAIAVALERMRYEGVVDMFQTVKLLRWQRVGLVQTASEYAFCYAAALEYLESFERYVT
ncbi:hypothetical protein CRM22_007752 [Opisthorchis felineus]|uniref:protein-tyrosine-phosphatase n=1 Tax=Opisthorchis felineus TaxID=147828 RepID=A0A4S2LED4_OPIFE|nr:hypothetical protein CRM22_007752 [Opisthorchis felineus]